MEIMPSLDKRDYQILFELDSHARQSISDIARKTRLSRDVINYRITRLEEMGIIKGYFTVINFGVLVSHIVRLYVRLQNTTPEIEEKMTSFLLKNKNILTVYSVDGFYHMAVGFLVNELADYKAFYNEFLKHFRRYVVGDNVSFFVEYVHYPRNYLVESKMRRFTSLSVSGSKLFPSGIKDLDAKDLELLSLIKEDARITLLELAAKLEMTATGAKYKLRRLEKNKVIVGYKVLLDIGKLGYDYYKVDLMLEDLSILLSLQEFILRHPNIIYQDITVGGSDFEFDGEFKSQEDFYSFMDELRSLFPGKIRSYHYYKARKIYKYSYFPESLVKKSR